MFSSRGVPDPCPNEYIDLRVPRGLTYASDIRHHNRKRLPCQVAGDTKKFCETLEAGPLRRGYVIWLDLTQLSSSGLGVSVGGIVVLGRCIRIGPKGRGAVLAGMAGCVQARGKPFRSTVQWDSHLSIWKPSEAIGGSAEGGRAMREENLRLLVQRRQK